MLCIITLIILIIIVSIIINSNIEPFMDCPNNYNRLCAKESYDSLSKSWCALAAANIKCSDPNDNYSQPECSFNSDLDLNSYNTDNVTLCNPPKKEYFY